MLAITSPQFTGPTKKLEIARVVDRKLKKVDEVVARTDETAISKWRLVFKPTNDDEQGIYRTTRVQEVQGEEKTQTQYWAVCRMGDLYQCVPLPYRHTTLLLGAVPGKGVGQPDFCDAVIRGLAARAAGIAVKHYSDLYGDWLSAGECKVLDVDALEPYYGVVCEAMKSTGLDPKSYPTTTLGEIENALTVYVDAQNNLTYKETAVLADEILDQCEEDQGDEAGPHEKYVTLVLAQARGAASAIAGLTNEKPELVSALLCDTSRVSHHLMSYNRPLAEAFPDLKNTSAGNINGPMLAGVLAIGVLTVTEIAADIIDKSKKKG